MDGRRMRKHVPGPSDSIGNPIKQCEYYGEDGRNNREKYRDLNRNMNDGTNKINFNSGKNTEMSSIYNLLSEDMRISKVLRRLVGENNPTIAKDLCKKLEIAVEDTSNAAYIKRAFDFLADSIISVFRHGPVECLNHLAKVFGILGFVARKDFPLYKSWISRNYDSCKEIRVYLMRALKVTFRYDSNTLELSVFSERVLLQLKDYLENSDIVENFIAVSDCIAEFSNNYKKSFEKHFQDIVDIVVGWHLETEQPLTLKLHCSNVLQHFSDFFFKKIDFTLGLLEQFLEDIAVFGDDIDNSKEIALSKSSHQQAPEVSVGSFIGAFNSIIKCLVNDSEILAFKLPKHNNFFNGAVQAITRVAKLSLQKNICSETLQSINEFFVLILSQGGQSVTCDIDQVIEVIKLQERNIEMFNENQIGSFLFLILHLIQHLQQNLPIHFVEFLLDSRTTKLKKLKFVKNEKIFKIYLKIYQEILLIKNVPILQEAYKHILYELRLSTKKIFNNSKNENNCLSSHQAECLLNFHLCSLSVLAKQTSSIIGMYALQPSILELLLKDLEAANIKLWLISPNLHKSLLNLLIVHCSRNHNYLLSSNLLSGNSSLFSKLSLDDSSPTSENFSLILKFHSDIILNGAAIYLENDIFAAILNWLITILSECSNYSAILIENYIFLQIANNLCKTSIETTKKKNILECAKCIENFIKFHKNIHINVTLTIAEVCCLHMSSTDYKIRTVYSNLYSKLPLSLAITAMNGQPVGFFKNHNSRQNELRQWYISTLSGSNFREKYFKEFIEKIMNNNEASFIGKDLPDIFVKCWVATNKPRYIEFYQNSLNNINLLFHWIQWESAQYCVNNKLRTILGKPQDTFFKIEALIKENARILALKDSSKVNSFDTLMTNQRHAKVLLSFLESLEKSIYNASEGTAFAINLPEKPARTFFRVNISTCNEWFNRIRTAVNLVALHCSEHEMVIRFSEVMLRNMVSSNKTNEPLFDHTLMSFVWALLKSGSAESETLSGLYTWVKLKTGKRYSWIKYVAEHAIGHREKAAEGYLNSLKSNAESGNFDKYFRDFIINQVIDCLYFTRQWSALIEVFESVVVDEEQKELTNLLNLSLKQIRNYKTFEDTLSPSVINLTDWDHFENFENLNNNFSYYKLISQTENTLIELILHPKGRSPEENNFKLKHCKSYIRTSIEECLRTGSKEHLNHLIILNHIGEKISNLNEKILLFEDFPIEKQTDTITLIRLKRWSDIFYSSQPNVHIKNYDELHLNLISSARKQNNFSFCKIELEEFFKHENSKFKDVDLWRMSKFIEQNLDYLKSCSENEIKALCETSKWLFNQSDFQQEGIQLASCVCLKILNDSHSAPSSLEKNSRMLLNLSDWLPQCYDSIFNSRDYENTSVKKLVQRLSEINAYPDECVNQVIPASEMLVGKLILMSVKQYPDLAKAWSALGNWYYRWGRKIVEAKTDANAGLSTNDIDAIQALIPNFTNEVVQDIVAVLNQHQVIAIDDEEIGSGDQSSTDIIEQQLRIIPAIKTVPVDIIISVIGIWRKAHKSVYSYYEMAADAYFKFLNLAASTTETNSSEEVCESYGDCSMVTATLRLLRLVVKHALGLQEVLEEGLSSTPTKPWKAIIPQLFSRLNHHELYVRKRVSELLCRVAKDSPHLIIFPAVVGAAQKDKSQNLMQLRSAEKKTDDTNEVKDFGEKTNPLGMCFNSLLSILYKQTPETVDQVQLLEKELKRISLLWDEFWLHALAQLYTEYSELFNSFEAEVKKCSNDDKFPLLHEKHKILIGHIVNDLERLYNCTSQTPETNYETQFQEKYSKIIEYTMESLRSSPLNIEKPNESWQKIKHLYSIFQQKFQRNFQTSLKMSDISPILANLKNTVVSMPGVETGESDPIFIKSVENIVYILPTKTKPKKLAFYGSDGKKYTYLFKGLEDLHLDERIMQFLSISNSMMAKSNSGNIYRAHHYSVIPLGPQSGLISWVDGVTPLFALYKKWQQREASNTTLIAKKDQKPFQQQQIPYVVMRPSEMFYKKLNPLLAEENLKPTDSRKSWPLAILRKVLEELSKETPKDLLAKELWCFSSNAAEWRMLIKTYSRSVAVMSVIGYVIGLGDRHLDNVLVQLSTGNIIHIDYNVCFEKGKTLRVPERVPFRMTPNLEEALGLTGIEGTFRLTCEHVLKTLRKEREILLTLLEAFVYDPLVDWAVSDDGTAFLGNEENTNTTSTLTRTTKALMAAVDIAALGNSTPILSITTEGNGNSKNNNQNIESTGNLGDRRPSRKRLENEIMRNTLSTRFAEIKPEWTQYKNDLIEQLQEISDSINELEAKRLEIKDNEKQRDSLSKQYALIREISALGTAMSSHPLNTLSQRYESYKRAWNEFEIFKKMLETKLEEYNEQRTGYFETTSIDKWTDIQICRNDLDVILPFQNEFECCKEFLDNSAQSQLFLQADQARKELGASVNQQLIIAKVGLDTLQQYLNVIQFYPKSVLKNHRLIWYESLFKSLLENPQNSKEVIENFERLTTSNEIVNISQITSYAYELERLWLEANFNLRKSYDLLNNESPIKNQKTLREVHEAISMFIESEPIGNSDLQTVINTSLLSNTIEIANEFINFEESSSYLLTPSWFLDELTVSCTQLTESFSICKQLNFTDIMSQFSLLIQSLRQMEGVFRAKIIPSLVQLFMLDDALIVKHFEDIKQLQNIYSIDLINKKVIGEENVSFLRESFENIKAEIINLQFKEILDIIDVVLRNCSVNLKNLIKSFENLKENQNFYLMDHVLRSRKMMEKLHNSSDTLDLRFEVMKFNTIIQLVAAGTKLSTSVKLSDVQYVYDINLFLEIISNLLSNIIKNSLIGLGSHLCAVVEIELLSSLSVESRSATEFTCDSMLLTAIEQNILNGHYSLPLYTRIQGLWKKFLNAVKQNVLVENLKLSIASQTESLQHMQIISTVHFWINEKVLLTQPAFGHIIHKNSILQNIQGSLQNLRVWQMSIDKIHTELLEFTTAISQRLKWAVGANQSLLSLQKSFEISSVNNENKFRKFSMIVTSVLKHFSFILAYEMLKVNTHNADKEFLVLTEQTKQSLALKCAADLEISPVEKGIVELLNPEGNIDYQWIENISGLLDEITDGVQNTIVTLEKDIRNKQDNLQVIGHKLKSLLGSELQIDVRYLLKLVFKIEGGHQAQRQKHFQANYKEFLGRISDLHMKILSKDFTENNCREIQELIGDIHQELNEIYEELLKLVSEGNESCENIEVENNMTTTPVKEKKRGNQPEQKRNAYAVSVWRRIRMKLEGRDPDPNKRQTVAEQVDWMIREARNPDNLAVLYEGWTPWV